MKKKAVRAITGLLCAAMVFSHMAGMRVYAMEDGTGQEAQMQESVSGNDDTGEAQEEPGENVQESADGGTEPESGSPEEPAEPDEGDREKDGQEKGEEKKGEEGLEETGAEPEAEAAGTVSENTAEAETDKRIKGENRL